MEIPKSLRQFVDIIIDSYFIIDLEHNIVDFNTAFYTMLPRPIARTVKAKKCYEVLQLDICKENCIARQCWTVDRNVRLDEITGSVSSLDQPLRFIISAIPIRNEKGELIGAMEMQRNVTDEALVQVKYQQQMDIQAKLQKKLEEDLHERTQLLLSASRRLRMARLELFETKTVLFG